MGDDSDSNAEPSGSEAEAEPLLEGTTIENSYDPEAESASGSDDE